jgi:hypothetical protein
MVYRHLEVFKLIRIPCFAKPVHLNHLYTLKPDLKKRIFRKKSLEFNKEHKKIAFEL